MFYFDIGTSGLNQPGQPQGSSLGLTTYMGQEGITFADRNQGNPYSFRYNFNIQHQLPWDTVVEAGYAGNHAVHLAVNHNLNFVPNQYLSKSPVRDQAVINSLTANVPNPFAGLLPGTTLNGSTTTASQLLAAYPQFTGVTLQNEHFGSSYFQMPQTRLNKRFSGGLQLPINYQYSKLIEMSSRLNGGDNTLSKDISVDDRPQRIVVSGRWELPFGKGTRFGAGRGRIVDGVIGGRSVNGIYTLQVGAALSWGNVLYLGGPLNNQPRNVDGVFEVTRFDRDSTHQLGSNLRTFANRFSNLRQDGVNNLDFSALKRFRVCSGFGLLMSQSNLSRRTQMALRLVW